MKNKLSRISLPYFVWMTLLVLLPTILLLVLAFAKTNGTSFDGFEFTFDNAKKFFANKYYMKALWNSLLYGGLATIITLLIAFPVAYTISRIKSDKKNLILLLIILPMWTNMLLRVISWEKIFKDMELIGSSFAVITTMVSVYLPFMIFPIYTALEKIDKTLLEAAADLGCNKFKTFLKVLLPLAMPGIISGIIMVFLPAMTAFAIPERLSNGKLIMIGNLIESTFMTENNFNMGSFISLFVLVVIFATTFKGTVGADDEK